MRNVIPLDAIRSRFQITGPSNRWARPLVGLVFAAVPILALWMAGPFSAGQPGLQDVSTMLLLALAVLGITLLVTRNVSRVPSRSASTLVIGEGPVAAVVMSALTLQQPRLRGLGALQSITNVANEAEAREVLRANAEQVVIVASPNASFAWNGTRGQTPVLYASDVIADLTGRLPMNLVATDRTLTRMGDTLPLPPMHAVLKRAIDLAFALIFGAAFLVVLPILALIIRLDSPGPVFYRQTRVGLGNKPFTLIKLRSMRTDAEAGGAQWAREGDTRVTRVGAFLRKSRIDELPQLWNILRGDMTLVGPRPERPEFTTELERKLPFYAKRHAVKPGLTGWAQVRYRYASSFHDSAVKLEHDLYYVKRISPKLDLKILLMTIQVVVRLRGR